jgi:CheY-like chemotaxis protein
MSHVLVVDDEEAVCWALQRALKGEGHSVSVAASAEEALEQAAKKRPDAVVLDVRLPGLDGLPRSAGCARSPAMPPLSSSPLSVTCRPQ